MANSPNHRGEGREKKEMKRKLIFFFDNDFMGALVHSMIEIAEMLQAFPPDQGNIIFRLCPTARPTDSAQLYFNFSSPNGQA
jgi:hypothetical protein